MEDRMASLYHMGGSVTAERLKIGATPLANIPAANIPAKATYEDYLAKVVKTIPTEVVSIYLLGKVIGPDYEMRWTLVCWVIVFALRWLATRGDGKVLNVTLAMIAFPLWVMATGGTIFGYAFPQQVTGLSVLAFSVLAGALYNDT